jgi:CBS-domain-containing membrane protein
MNARDVMNTEVVSVEANASARQIAKILVENGISAVPVVDAAGAPIGIVSEGDLIDRDEADRMKRRDWWLSLLAEGETPDAERIAKLVPRERTARDMMSAPVVTVGEGTDITEIARLLAAYRIKRVPVVSDGRMVGIVARADLVRALAAEPPAPHRHEPARPPAMTAAPAMHPKTPNATEPTVSDFRSLAEHARQEETHRREAALRQAEEQQRQAVQELIEHHVTDESWRGILQRMRHAAEHGEKESMLLRFSSKLCSDGGRAVNAPEPDWPETLRGEPAEIYLRWERELKPHGFRLTARVLDFPGGFPGDLGLFLVWGG